MRILVNGVRLYFDVAGQSHVPAGDRMETRPTLVLLHGGPGIDHSIYKPAFSQLCDVAQVVFLDHRGNGRSDAGAQELWTLAQWADDLHAFCEALEIKQPIVYGASFGGIVAMAYAQRYPDHPRKLVLVSTEAVGGSHARAKVEMFSRLGGEPVGALARRRFIDFDTSPEVLAAWIQLAFPLYTRTPTDPGLLARTVRRPETTAWFNRPGGEGRSFNLLPGLARIACPTLLLGGKLDPMTPIECQRDIAAAINPRLLQYHEFDDCGHAVIPDASRAAMALIRRFMQEPS